MMLLIEHSVGGCSLNISILHPYSTAWTDTRHPRILRIECNVLYIPLLHLFAFFYRGGTPGGRAGEK